MEGYGPSGAALVRLKDKGASLVVTVNTVEFHLRNTYAKLGIRSRSQLAGRLAEVADAEGTG